MSGSDDIPHRIRDRARHTRRIAGALTRAAGRRILGRSADADRQLGEALVAELDQLKGMAMKVGQILSYMDGAVPEETQRVLAKLQEGSEPMDLAHVEAVVQDEPVAMETKAQIAQAAA